MTPPPVAAPWCACRRAAPRGSPRLHEGAAGIPHRPLPPPTGVPYAALRAAGGMPRRPRAGRAEVGDPDGLGEPRSQPGLQLQPALHRGLGSEGGGGGRQRVHRRHRPCTVGRRYNRCMLRSAWPRELRSRLLLRGASARRRRRAPLCRLLCDCLRTYASSSCSSSENKESSRQGPLGNGPSSVLRRALED
jgi:hypothetical protein